MAANGKPGRTKVPLLTQFAMCGYSPRHEIPFHVVGIADGRHYSVAIRRDQMDAAIENMIKARTQYDEAKAQATTQNTTESP